MDRYHTVARALRALFALALLAGLAACTGGEETADRGSGDEATEGDSGDESPAEETTEDTEVADGEDPARGGGDGSGWTIMAYSMADTNLESDMVNDVVEMSQIGTQPGLNIVNLIDRAEGETDAPLGSVGDFTGTKLLEVVPGDVVELEDRGEVDMADPAVLSEFIEYSVANYPAERYALVLSDHGGGYPGIGPDESSGTIMDLAGVQEGVENGLALAGLERLDLIGFDACLMATYEVATTMQPYATHMLASEETEPGHGWNYNSLQVIVDDPSIDAATLGNALIQGFNQQATDSGTEQAITLSLLDLDQMPAMDEAMAAFAAALVEQGEAIAPVVGQQRANTLEFGRAEDPTQGTQMTDLGVFVAEIGVQSLQVADQADAVIRALGDVVVDRVNGPALEPATGMSIYFPRQLEIADPDYGGVPGAADWSAFLDSYFGAGEAIPVDRQPEFVPVENADPEGGATLTVTDEGLEVTGQLDTTGLENISEARISYGYVDEATGSIVQLGDEGAEVADDGTVFGFTDLTQFMISDGEDTIQAYLAVDFDDETGKGLATVPLRYTAPESAESEDVQLQIVFDSTSGDVEQETFFLVDETGTWGELEADPLGLLSSEVLLFDGSDPAGTWIPFSENAVYADLPILTYELTKFPSGSNIYADVVATDFGGNVALVSGTVVLP